MKNKDELKLYIPKVEELEFYKYLLSDPDTMSYNAPWYPPDGCIDFPREKNFEDGLVHLFLNKENYFKEL